MGSEREGKSPHRRDDAEGGVFPHSEFISEGGTLRNFQDFWCPESEGITCEDMRAQAKHLRRQATAESLHSRQTNDKWSGFAWVLESAQGFGQLVQDVLPDISGEQHQ